MKYRMLAACTALVMLLTGCSALPGITDDEPSETVVVYQALPLPDLFAKIPEGYEETSSEFYERYYVKDDASIIITEDTSEEVFNTSAKDYSIRAINQYKEMTNTFELFGNEELAAGVLTVFTLEFNYTLSEDGPKLSTMAGFTSDGETVFIVTCKCAAENYEQHRAEFVAVMESLCIERRENQAE